jgi:hypothetical protein
MYKPSTSKNINFEIELKALRKKYKKAKTHAG